MKNDAFVTYTDGGARGNPGPAALGAVIIEPNGTTHRIKKYLGVATNNQAEYKALLAALQKTVELGARSVVCYLDSELVVKQMNREYRVKDPELGKIYIQIWNLAQQFQTISFHHVRREKNKDADALVNEALDEHGRA
ncbi:MAG: ribonuclease HI family protein [Patescibacteria group bacterium]